MKPDTPDPEAIIDAMAPYLGLEIAEGYRAGVATHLAAAHSIARDVLAFETEDGAEPAPVYTP